MFTWLNKQGVRSDRGFEVQFTGRFDAEYREGGKVVKLYVESGVNGGLPCIVGVTAVRQGRSSKPRCSRTLRRRWTSRAW
jgi:hypothetical protein